ncbi:MAG: CvpA family protein [bacterium]|nr:CvpA family protein [bacterium]
MNFIDITILCILLYNGFQGFRRGLLKLLVDLLAFSGGFYTGMRYYKQLSNILKVNINVSSQYASLLSFIIIWAICFALVSLTGILLDKIIKVAFLGAFNRLGGLIFGMAKGCIILIPVMLPVLFFKPELINESSIARPFTPVFDHIKEKYSLKNIMKSDSIKRALEDGLSDKGIKGMDKMGFSKSDLNSEGMYKKIKKLINENNIKFETLEK